MLPSSSQVIHCLDFFFHHLTAKIVYSRGVRAWCQNIICMMNPGTEKLFQQQKEVSLVLGMIQVPKQHLWQQCDICFIGIGNLILLVHGWAKASSILSLTFHPAFQPCLLNVKYLQMIDWNRVFMFILLELWLCCQVSPKLSIDYKFLKFRQSKIHSRKQITIRSLSQLDYNLVYLTFVH